MEHHASDNVATALHQPLPLHIPDLILGIQSVEENEVIAVEIEVVQEATESKLDQVNNLLATVTIRQEQANDPHKNPPNPCTVCHRRFLTEEQLAERWQCTLKLFVGGGRKVWPKFLKINNQSVTSLT